MNEFHEMETPVSDAAMAAQILASLFEDAHTRSATRNSGQIVLSDNEAEMISFMIYDVCRRTHEVHKVFQSAVDAEKQPDTAKAA
ncbi:hypothetical protein [Devosia sp. Naph2]|uniref:hypothetical protein n=1 Tax=Devosia polycyclovorans TaxID=3345148 RepID=UPI0035CFB576